MSIGKRIRKRRKELNLTQNDLSRMSNVTHQHISAIEQDKSKVSLELLSNIAKSLGVTTDFLITGYKTIVFETIPAIKADKKLSLKAKNALIGMVEELYKSKI